MSDIATQFINSERINERVSQIVVVDDSFDFERGFAPLYFCSKFIYEYYVCSFLLIKKEVAKKYMV